jgi:cysteine desulfurase
MKLPIYLDYAATTPVDERVAKEMMQCLTMDGNFGNPASRSHRFGWQAEEAVDQARTDIADLINADPREIVFTSGATESNNLAIKGAAQFYKKKGKHVITVKTEHKAVLDTCRELERQGFEVTYMDVEENGLLDLKKLEAAMRDDTVLVSVMHVNNELGVIQDIATIGEMCRERKIMFHVDAAQSAGKVLIDVQQLKVDFMSFSGHKVYGPKGVGALYVRRKPRARLEAQMHGGGHERGMRSGTLATHQLVGMGAAFRISSGSACTSASLEPSYVLRALGRNDELAHSSIRFSIGRFTTEEEIDYTVELIKNSIGRLREMSPLWEMHQEGIDLDSVEWAHH